MIAENIDMSETEYMPKQLESRNLFHYSISDRLDSDGNRLLEASDERDWND